PFIVDQVEVAREQAPDEVARARGVPDVWVRRRPYLVHARPARLACPYSPPPPVAASTITPALTPPGGDSSRRPAAGPAPAHDARPERPSSSSTAPPSPPAGSPSRSPRWSRTRRPTFSNPTSTPDPGGYVDLTSTIIAFSREVAHSR